MSDVHVMANDWPVPTMAAMGTKCPGHEGAGVVVALGKDVSGWKIGDRAGIKAIWDTCGSCELCLNGKENYCDKTVMTGLAVNGGPLLFSAGLSTNAGYRDVPTIHDITCKIYKSHS